jgi:protein-disulfide isomerase
MKPNLNRTVVIGSRIISLTPGFSPVLAACGHVSRFNGFPYMPLRIFRVLAVFAALQSIRVIAQEPTQHASERPAPSVQQQLDQLRTGQEQLRQELDELKALLQERMLPTNSTTPAVPEVSSVNVRGEPFRGTNTARVAVIEYSDFGCSFCARYAREIFPRLDEEYVKPGKLRYFFRDLPEPKETNSWFKARAARCAGDQGKFWELHDLLFNAPSASEKDVTSLAQTIGLDTEKFNQCLLSEKYLVNIQRSVAGAKKMGLFGTPAFLIGAISEDSDFVMVKRVLVGTESYESMKSILDELMASPSSH